MCWISSTTNYNLISGHLNNWLTIIFILFCVSFFDSKCLKYKQKKTSTMPLILFFMNLKYIVKKNKKWFWQHIGQIQVLISNEQKILWIKQIKRSEKKKLQLLTFWIIKTLIFGRGVKTKGFNSFLPASLLPTENGAELSWNVDCC